MAAVLELDWSGPEPASVADLDGLAETALGADLAWARESLVSGVDSVRDW